MDDSMRAATKRVAVFKTKDGKEIVFHSLTFSDYASASEQALAEYRRERIKAWTDNADLMPEASREAWIREAFETAQKLTVNDLPKKKVERELTFSNGKPIEEDGEPVEKEIEVEYTIWWMSKTVKGMMHMAWLSLRKDPSQQDMTPNDVDVLFRENTEDLEGAANIVGDLSNPTLVGNQEPPPEKTEGGRKQRRKQRRGR